MTSYAWIIPDEPISQRRYVFHYNMNKPSFDKLHNYHNKRRQQPQKLDLKQPFNF